MALIPVVTSAAALEVEHETVAVPAGAASWSAIVWTPGPAIVVARLCVTLPTLSEHVTVASKTVDTLGFANTRYDEPAGSTTLFTVCGVAVTPVALLTGAATWVGAVGLHVTLPAES